MNFKPGKLVGFLQMLSLCTLLVFASACGRTGGKDSGGRCISTMEFQATMLTKGNRCAFVYGSGCGGPAEHQANMDAQAQVLVSQGWTIAPEVDWQMMGECEEPVIPLN